MKAFSRFITYLLHPLFMPTLGTALLLVSNNYLNYMLSNQVKLLICLMILINTFILPGIIFLGFYRRGYLKDLYVHERNERLFPYIITLSIYLLSYFFFRNTSIPDHVYYMILGAAAAIVVIIVINFQWKISAHMTGIGGLAGAMFTYSQMLHTGNYGLMMFIFMLAGILAMVRLYLNAHTPTQIYAGFVLGFLAEAITLRIML
jgi:membrane-associated phospholipid phosphatase